MPGKVCQFSTSLSICRFTLLINIAHSLTALQNCFLARLMVDPSMMYMYLVEVYSVTFSDNFPCSVVLYMLALASGGPVMISESFCVL